MLFTEAKFPCHFGSYREYQSASAFRKQMLDYGLWSEFKTYCKHDMDFQVAGDMDPNVQDLQRGIPQAFWPMLLVWERFKSKMQVLKLLCFSTWATWVLIVLVAHYLIVFSPLQDTSTILRSRIRCILLM